ncbi:glycerol-3-phosphate dehydrogenase [Desulfogranum mediterraneum]|uniref:glycerol-3-phosphate dehydrogenase n=1 Tax=Desulfogranum mediterraneum TaxID=160661 RepID=UPI0003F4F7AD|nr:glycerol-3-phosphate dehydrogenase [Desulfogranum mediterraneum]
MEEKVYDLAIVGGGINGCGIARDAAGRGLSVLLCEQGDLAGGTSSASTKLIHGGLRYLEYYEFRLVRESLREREVLLKAAPHIIWPLRFILPHHRGLRPAWLIRLGLFIYDHLGGRKLLPPTSSLDLGRDEAGAVLKKEYSRGFEYSDCWVMDSRLVILNAMDAARLGAEIKVRSRCLSAERSDRLWTLCLEDQESGEESSHRARILINATGPWLGEFMDHVSHEQTRESIRMVKGSHIIIRRLFEHGRAYLFQNEDGRIIFAIPYEDAFTLIGTTDVDFSGDPGKVKISPEEISYLCAAASEYFRREVSSGDVVHSYSGIRPLFDDGVSDAKAATRDYILRLDSAHGSKPPLLSIYGGKITTYRKLAESVLEKLADFLPATRPWSAGVCLPGGGFSPSDFEGEVLRLKQAFPFLGDKFAYRLVRTYGRQAFILLKDIKKREDLGSCFGSDLYACEVRYLMAHEWARSAEDILWRRTNLGLFLSTEEQHKLQSWIEQQPAKEWCGLMAGPDTAASDASSTIPS